MGRRRIAIAAARTPGVACCDACLRPAPRAKRTERGLRYCAACYKRFFSSRSCGACGAACIALTAGPAPSCRPCRDRDRRCIRCGREATEAGRMLAEGVECRSCAYHSATLRGCPSCGLAAKRLSRIGGNGEAVCDRCRRAAQCATCGRCGRHRRPAGRDGGDRPICRACLGGASRTCPDCGAEVPGSGAAPCRSCAARRRGRTRAAIGRASISQPWVAALHAGFCEEQLLAPAPRGDVVRMVDAATSFFAVLDRQVRSRSELDPGRLRAIFGASGLRRSEKASAYVCRSLGILWERAGADHAVARRADGVVAAAAGRPWAELLEAYGRHVAAPSDGRSRSARTRLAYVRTAAALLTLAESEERAVPDARDVRRLLWRSPGSRASLSPFLKWLGERHGAALALPRRRRPDGKAAELRVLARGASLVAALEACERPRAATALLAACLSNLFGVPLEQILSLRHDAVRRDAAVVVHLDELDLELPDRIAVQFERWTDVTRVGLLFPGRSGLKPLSTEAVRYHVSAATAGSRPETAAPTVDDQGSPDEVRRLKAFHRSRT